MSPEPEGVIDEDITTEAKEPIEKEIEAAPREETKKPKIKKPKEKPKEYEIKTEDGQVVKIPLSGKLKKIVDGEEKEFTVNDVLDRFAAEEGYQKKFHKLAEERKTFEQEQQSLKQQINQFNEQKQLIAAHLAIVRDAFVRGQMDEFVGYFAQLMGINPVEAASHMRKSYLPKLQQYYEADEATKKTLDLEETNEYLKKQNELYNGVNALQHKLREAEQYARNVFNQSGLSEAEWHQAKKAINDKYLGGRDLILEKAQPHEIQQYCEAIILQGRAFRQETQIDSLINKVDSELKTKSKEEYDHIAKIISPFIGDMSDEDLIEVIKKYLGKEDTGDDEQSEEEAVEIDDDKPTRKKVARRRLASDSEEDFDDFLKEVEEEVDKDPLSVYDHF
jgi:hypothetical protein